MKMNRKLIVKIVASYWFAVLLGVIFSVIFGPFFAMASHTHVETDITARTDSLAPPEPTP